MKGQGGIFLETPDGPVYLRQIKGISPGETLLVQVTSHAEPGKAVPVTHKILFKSRYAIVTPEAPGLNVSRQIKDDDLRDALLEIAHELMEGSEYGLILRSSCDGADEAAIAEDIAEMRTLAESVMADKSRGPSFWSKATARKRGRGGNGRCQRVLSAGPNLWKQRARSRRSRRCPRPSCPWAAVRAWQSRRRGRSSRST